MSTKAWDDLAAACKALQATAATGRSELALRPVIEALGALAESEGSGGQPAPVPSHEESDED